MWKILVENISIELGQQTAEGLIVFISIYPQCMSDEKQGIYLQISQSY